MSEPQVIYENEDFLVIDKPSGLMVHGVKMGARVLGMGDGAERNKKKNFIPHTPYPIPEPTLVDWLLARYPEIKTVGDDPAQRPGIVHRLDKDTSGVMLVARNQASFEYLKSLFQKHEIKKTYLAVVFGELKKKEGIIDAPIGILTGSTRRSVRSTKMAKEAVTEWRTLGDGGWGMGDGEEKDSDKKSIPHTPYPIPSVSLLEVRPKTGRTHQIRVHLASIGHPILGDALYGTKISRAAAPRLMLHASSLEFTAREGKRMRFEAEIPEEFRFDIQCRTGI